MTTGTEMRACENCGHQNQPAADFCANPECRTYLGWSTVGTTPATPPRTPPLTPPVEPARPVADSPTPPNGQRAGFRVKVEPAEVTVDPGGTASVRVLAENTGTRVEQLVVTVHGAAGAFARPEPATLSVYPGAREQAVVTFRPDRAPRHAAGEVPYRVELRSSIHQDMAAVASGTVTVTPFVELVAHLEPGASSSRRAGQHTVVVENRGNAPATVAVDFDDRAKVVELNPRKGGATIAPGARAGVSTWVRGPRKGSYPFTAVVTRVDGGHPPITLEGVRHQRPRSTWVVWLVPLLLLLWLLAAVANEFAGPGADVPVEDTGETDEEPGTEETAPEETAPEETPPEETPPEETAPEETAPEETGDPGAIETPDGVTVTSGLGGDVRRAGVPGGRA